jgi:hypothetical protein
MLGGFTLFGFDLFGLAQRRQANTPSNSPESVHVQKKSEEKKDDDRSMPDHSESFFWGMYPVY